MFGLGVGIDLGTSSVMIYVEGKGIVLTEPSVIACDKTEDGKMIAVGESAYRMIGRNPDSISVIRPLKDGVVSDFPYDGKNATALYSKDLRKPYFQAARHRLHAQLRNQSGETDDS